MTTDAGGLLLRQTDLRLNVLARLAECFVGRRGPKLIRHSVRQLVAQRVYARALGYEDLNDHDQLRQEPALRLMAGKEDIAQEALAARAPCSVWKAMMAWPAATQRSPTGATQSMSCW
jgi:hypothetical protein